MLDKPSLQTILEVQKHFALPSPVLVEKDWYVVTALAAINSADLKPSATLQQRADQLRTDSSTQLASLTAKPTSSSTVLDILIQRQAVSYQKIRFASKAESTSIPTFQMIRLHEPIRQVCVQGGLGRAVAATMTNAVNQPVPPIHIHVERLFVVAVLATVPKLIAHASA